MYLQSKQALSKINIVKQRIRDYLLVHKPDALMSFIAHGHEFDSPINLYLSEIMGTSLFEHISKALQSAQSGDVILQLSGREDFPDIIFAIMPIWDTSLSNEEKFLSRCYRNTLSLAAEQGYRDLALPALGLGKSNFPHNRVVRLSLSAIVDSYREPLEHISIICAEDKMYNAYNARIELLTSV